MPTRASDTPTRRKRRLWRRTWGARASMSVVTSFVTRARSFGAYVLYHFASRTLPCLLTSKKKWICAPGGTRAWLLTCRRRRAADAVKAPTRRSRDNGTVACDRACHRACLGRASTSLRARGVPSAAAAPFSAWRPSRPAPATLRCRAADAPAQEMAIAWTGPPEPPLRLGRPRARTPVLAPAQHPRSRERLPRPVPALTSHTGAARQRARESYA